jgi:hypothetical protein
LTLAEQHLLFGIVIANWLWIRPWLTGLKWDQDVIITLSIVMLLLIIAQAYNAFK